MIPFGYYKTCPYCMSCVSLFITIQIAIYGFVICLGTDGGVLHVVLDLNGFTLIVAFCHPSYTVIVPGYLPGFNCRDFDTLGSRWFSSLSIAFFTYIFFHLIINVVSWDVTLSQPTYTRSNKQDMCFMYGRHRVGHETTKRSPPGCLWLTLRTHMFDAFYCNDQKIFYLSLPPRNIYQHYLCETIMHFR